MYNTTNFLRISKNYCKNSLAADFRFVTTELEACISYNNISIYSCIEIRTPADNVAFVCHLYYLALLSRALMSKGSSVLCCCLI